MAICTARAFTTLLVVNAHRVNVPRRRPPGLWAFTLGVGIGVGIGVGMGILGIGNVGGDSQAILL